MFSTFPHCYKITLLFDTNAGCSSDAIRTLLTSTVPLLSQGRYISLQLNDQISKSRCGNRNTINSYPLYECISMYNTLTPVYCNQSVGFCESTIASHVFWGCTRVKNLNCDGPLNTGKCYNVSI